MKKRSTTKNIIAITALVAVLALLYLFLGGFAKLRDLSGKPIVLEVDFDQAISEDSSASPLRDLGLTRRLTTLQDTLAAIEAASKDERVKSIIGRVGTGVIGLAQRQDLRDAILKFRKSGKKAYAYSETFGEFSGGTGNYYLATAFDKIFLQPSGDVGLIGARAEVPFFRGTLDKLEIVPRGGQRYEYKNALDTFTEKQMTPAYREAMTGLVGSLHQQIIAGIAQGRQMDPGQVQSLIDNGPYLAQQALEARLVDGLRYRDQVYEMAKKEAGKDAKLLYLDTYLNRRGNPYKKGERIALIYGVGGVTRGESNHNPFDESDVMGSDTVCAGFRAAAKDDNVKAIIFRVDSPGGSYVASDAILREIMRAREKGKPVIVSMGNVAASGGYFVSLAADKVIAEPGTITGSIGVLALKLLTTGFWNKLGVSWDSTQTARNANMYTNLTDYTPEQWAKFNAWLDRIYIDFTDKVAKGRRLPKERVLEIAKGRVWSGQDALRLGLVDELGGFTRAVESAREFAKIPAGKSVKLVRFPRPKSIFEALGGKTPESSETTMVRAAIKAIEPLRPALRVLGKLNQSPDAEVVAIPEIEIDN